MFRRLPIATGRHSLFVSELAGGGVILGVFVLRRLVDGEGEGSHEFLRAPVP